MSDPANHDDTAAHGDEPAPPEVVLPDPLLGEDGHPVRDVDDWRRRRRPEILRLFEEHVYGRMPGPPGQTTVELLEEGAALDGAALRRQVRLHFCGGGHRAHADLLLYLPASTPAPVPIFLGLNFFGNHAVHPDPAILLSTAWMRQQEGHGIVAHRATDDSRGVSASRWAVEHLVARGYGLATVYCGDFDPDFDDGYTNGVHPLFYRRGQQRPAPCEWGTIGAWAWGLRRCLDYLETDADVDARRVAVMGHSRLGKTALWAGATDERFALVISNNSGCGGAALSRRRVGETVARINATFPHWFCDNFHAYGEAEETCPVDQHQLLCLTAPRPLYVASATEDLWADPEGEFLAARGANPVYELHDGRPLTTAQMPAGGAVCNDGDIAYHLRIGGHDVTDWDWLQWLDFADRYLRDPQDGHVIHPRRRWHRNDSTAVAPEQTHVMSDWIHWRSEAPILRPERPWEHNGRLNAVALLPDPEGDALRLYYLVHHDDPLDNVLCLARSTDGRTWEKPDLGTGDNILLRSSGHETGWGVFMPTRILHEPQEACPAWRWKMVLWERPHAQTPAGICLAVSADGLRWSMLHERPVITGVNDAMSMITARDDIETPLGKPRWLLYQQTWKYNPHLPQTRDNLKGIHRRISLWHNAGEFDDAWTGPVTVLEPDAADPPDLQHYWLAPYRTAGGYGGLLLCHHTLDQTMDVQRVTSADGWTWRRADQRQPLLPLGERGRFDCGMVAATSAPCRWGDRVLLPYNGRATVHDQQPRHPEDPPVAPGIGLVELDPRILTEGAHDHPTP